jgi:hypothetical protein
MVKEQIDTLSDKDIAIYALYLLGGWQKRVHTEDIALKCYELAPSKFSWVKYPQYPDATPARFALEAAKKQKYGALVKGESERKRTSKNIGGWMLTDNGIEWAKANRRRIEEYLGKHVPTGDRLPANRKLRELTESAAFKKFRERGEQAEISHAEFAGSLICTVNTTAEVLNDRLDQLSSMAVELKREDIKSYIEFCRKRFSPLLGIRGGQENAKS